MYVYWRCLLSKRWQDKELTKPFLKTLSSKIDPQSSVGTTQPKFANKVSRPNQWTVTRCQMHDSKGVHQRQDYALYRRPAKHSRKTRNVAHHQTSIWRAVRDADTPELDIEKYGWRRDEAKISLVPTTILDTVSLAPDAVMLLISCVCERDTPCRSSRCGCRSDNLFRTMFCVCHGGICRNTNALWCVTMTISWTMKIQIIPNRYYSIYTCLEWLNHQAVSHLIWPEIDYTVHFNN